MNLWDLQDASWKGIPFHVASVDDQWQRRVARHSYPNRAGAELEDMDREPLELRIQAVFFGPDYLVELRRFIAAFEEGGTDVLVHPVLGSINAQCTGMGTRHTYDDRSMATVDLTFLEDQIDRSAFTVETDTRATALADVDASLTVAAAALAALS